MGLTWVGFPELLECAHCIFSQIWDVFSQYVFRCFSCTTVFLLSLDVSDIRIRTFGLVPRSLSLSSFFKNLVFFTHTEQFLLIYLQVYWLSSLPSSFVEPNLGGLSFFHCGYCIFKFYTFYLVVLYNIYFFSEWFCLSTCFQNFCLNSLLGT